MNRALASRFAVWMLLALACCSAGPSAAAQAPESQDSATAVALDCIFNPGRAPARKSMGLLQRSFLDVVEAAQPKLDIALVIDGTNSMARDIEGIRSAIGRMIDDLEHYRAGLVRFQLVVYRDTGSTSGEVSVPLQEFTGDRALLAQELAKIQPESGEPYFPELVDLGLHEALSRLPWSEDADTTRWIFLFGDAPPYDASFQEAETGARRRIDNDLIISLANRRQIQIHCILCTSRDQEQEAYSILLDRTRRFMSDMATNTGGLMLDLSYPDIRKALEVAAAKPRPPVTQLGQIRREEVESERQRAEQERSVAALNQRITFAVLPHLPLDRMSFDNERPEVQLATALRQKLRLIPRIEVKSPVDVDRQLRLVQARGIPADQQLSVLAGLLRADYVVWGNYQVANNVVNVESKIFDKAQGRVVAADTVQTSNLVPETLVAGKLTEQLVSNAIQSNADRALVATLVAFQQSSTASTLIRPVANDTESYRQLMAGLGYLEQALGYTSASPESAELLAKAEPLLDAAVARDERDPLAQLLLANCCANLAQLPAATPESKPEILRKYTLALQKAYRFRDQAPSPAVRTEIEADYALLVRRNAAEAIRGYESLARFEQDANLHSALRARWMLAGIYAGDWGVDAALKDPEKSRREVIQILANWPDSSEAAYYRQMLRWDDDKGGSQFAFTPQSHSEFATALPQPPTD